MNSNYRSGPMRQLRDQQVRFAPRDKKVAQLTRAERLLEELLPERTYSFEYLSFRVTDFRPESAPQETMSGEDSAHDLRLLIEDLSDAADLRMEEMPERMYTVDQLSAQFHVSTKTISRWRDLGLVSRRVIAGGRKRVAFLESSVDRFVRQNADRVRRGERFSQLTEQERGEIVERARRLARAGGCPSEVTRRIAERMDRSVETIRYTLKQFDEKHPQLAVFPNASGPLTEKIKQQIYQHYRRGSSAEALAKQHCRTKTSIYRVINEMRAKRIMELPLDYMPNEEFDRSGAASEILGPLPEANPAPRKSRMPSGLPPYLASLYEVPLLTRQQEGHLFRKFNFLKHQASKLRDRLDPARAKASVMDKIEKFYDQAVQVKNQIVRCNLRLVVSIAKRHVGGVDEFFELVSDGNMSLIRAVEKFDYSPAVISSALTRAGRS